MKVLILAIVLVAAVLAFIFLRQPSPLPADARAAEGFYSFEHSIEKFFAGRGPFKFSSPTNDANTGWTPMGSNQWEFHGAVLTAKERIPWKAIVEDKSTNWALVTLKVGNQVYK